MSRKKSSRRSPAAQAFHDAVRDIVAAEGWFEVSLTAPEPPRSTKWRDGIIATA